MRIKYKHKIAQTITAILVVVLLSLNAFAGSVPPYMNYQGILKDTSTGNSLTTGDYQIRFSLYDSPEGAPDAIEIWSQIIEPVKVVDGHFSVLLGGEGNALPDSFNSPDRFIEIHVGSVGDIPGNLEKLLNRQRIVGVGYAFQAEKASHSLTSDNATNAQHADSATNTPHSLTSDTIGGLRIVRGTINSNGSIRYGSTGFNSQRLGNGHYKITFSPAFSSIPTIVISAVQGSFPNDGAPWHRSVNLIREDYGPDPSGYIGRERTASEFEVVTRYNQGSPTDTNDGPWDFIAIGPN